MDKRFRHIELIDLGAVHPQFPPMGYGQWELDFEDWALETVQRQTHQDQQHDASGHVRRGRGTLKWLQADVLIALLFQHHLDLGLQLGQICLSSLPHLLPGVKEAGEIQSTGGGGR